MGNHQQIEAEEWVDRYGDALFQFARARIKKSDVAEEIVQETFLAAFKAKKGFKGKSSEKTWLFGILKHKIIDHFRKKDNIIHVHDFADDPERMEYFFNAKGAWQTKPSHWSTHPEKAQETKEFLDHLFRCIAGLPQRTADVFVHREIEGLTTKEICIRLDISENNCWVILYRARVLLRKCLELVGFNRNELQRWKKKVGQRK